MIRKFKTLILDYKTYRYETFFLIILSVLICAVSLSAQDINGVELYDELTHAEVLEMFGEPTEYHENIYPEDGVERWYYYGENYLYFMNDALEEFTISDSSYTTLEEYFEGGLKVGDPFSRLDGFEHGRLEKYPRLPDCYHLYIGMSDNWLTLYIEDGIIVSMNCHTLC